MIIGNPRELTRHEYRVGLTPVVARELTAAGHRVPDEVLLPVVVAS
jgi:alanine dehydrogenase